MNFRIAYSTLAALLLVLCTPVEGKPNIVIIFADDVGTGDVPGYWDGGTRNGRVAMPNLEYLLGNGTTFTDAHSTPLCAPSRYVLLSGNYQHRGEKFGGSWTVNYEGNQFRKRQKSIARVLGDSGYKTAMFGKWHLGGKIPIVDGFTVKSNDVPKKETMIRNPDHDWTKPMEQGPSDIGFQTSYVTLAGVQNPPYAFLRDGTLDMDPSTIAYWPTGNFSMPRGLSKIDSAGEGAPDWDSTAYNMILVNETEKFIDNHLKSRSEDPFFTYLALGAVHTPHSPPDHYLDGEQIAGVHKSGHMDVLYEVDKIVGSVVAMLEKRNLLEDTILVFTSDNGGLGTVTGGDESERNGHYSGGPLRAEKASIYEGGHRIPMTIRWDKGNVPRGEKRSHIVSLGDIFKTVSELAGVHVPRNQAVDSVSFARYLMDENDTEGLRESLGAWSFVKHGNSFRLGQESVRMGNMKLIHDYQNNTFELYDLSTDISESHNLVSAANGELVDELYEELKRIGPCHDNPNRFYVRRKKKRLKCKWFGIKNTWKRCEKFQEGWEHCRYTCALRSSRQCKKISEL
jgi:arylsulfatase A